MIAGISSCFQKSQERREFEGEQMVAPPDISQSGRSGRGGKSELHRAGWSVTRTAPREMAATPISRGKRKVPQKTYRPVK